MPPLIFNDLHFASENANGPNATRVVWDTPNGGTSHDNLQVYRFGDRGKDYDWLSPNRQAEGGAFPRPLPNTLNDRALSQVRFGRKGAVGADTPFISVATNYRALYNHGEPWVQKILRETPDLGVFVVPFDTVMRPSINSAATKNETEWLYYDGDHPIMDYLIRWVPNSQALLTGAVGLYG